MQHVVDRDRLSPDELHPELDEVVEELVDLLGNFSCELLRDDLELLSNRFDSFPNVLRFEERQREQHPEQLGKTLAISVGL